MDIHKPKPIHNWREFLKEFGTIVLGVSVALAGEQAVEWLHWQSEVKTARMALRVEMTTILDNFYAPRAAMTPCLDRKLDGAATAIADIAAGRQPDLHGMVFNTLGGMLNDGEWQSERASQTLTHFPREELALMSRFYGQVPDAHDWEAKEAIAWGNLAVLQDAGQKLGPADLAQLRVNYHLARRFLYLIDGNAGEQVALAAQLGVTPAFLTPARIAALCNRQTGTVKY